MTTRDNENCNKVNEFMMVVRGLINNTIPYIPYSFGNVRRLDINYKHIYLSQSPKGDINYSFSLFDKDWHSTTAAKLGNVLTQHFEVEIEVVNNEKEKLKKMINATSDLNKSLIDSNKHDHYNNYVQKEEITSKSKESSTPRTKDELLKLLDSSSKDVTSQIDNTQSNLNYSHPLQNQENLNQGVIQLSTYYLESHLNTIYIKLNELPIIYKEKFMPSIKLAFYLDNNGKTTKNNFIPTPFMVYPYNLCEPNQSFILLFILFMTKNDIHQALKILVWLADSSTSLNKLPFALVLHSKDDDYMKLFYEEIVEVLFHDFQCEKIENDTIDAKSLSKNLDEKAIYNFNNVATQTILSEPAYEFTNKLIYKDNCKINRKNITTVANILITSTSNYIPMINEDVQSAIVEVDSNIDKLCKYINIRPNRQLLARYIQNDLPNLIGILRCLDILTLNNTYPVINYDTPVQILNGDNDNTDVFDKLVRSKDIVPFNSNVKTKKEEKLVEKMEADFKQDRVDKAHLNDYFELLFGKGTYRSNNALIASLRKDYSNTEEPFDDIKTHVREGRGYYFL